MKHDIIQITAEDLREPEPDRIRVELPEETVPPVFSPSPDKKNVSPVFSRILTWKNAALCSLGILTLVCLLLTVSMTKNIGSIEQRVAEQAKESVVIVTMEAPADGFWDSLVRGNEQGVGTGIVIASNRSQQLILTNRHVVFDSRMRPARNLYVTTQDESTVPARIAALPKDPDIDLALILADAIPSIHPVWKIGKLKNVRQGDKVVAIGHPLGMDFSITNGICSSIRDDFLIQHSAAINPGNSGGPLLDQNGRIVGVNTFLIEDSQGIFFAFPADYVRQQHAWEFYEDIRELLKKVKYE